MKKMPKGEKGERRREKGEGFPFSLQPFTFTISRYLLLLLEKL